MLAWKHATYADYCKYNAAQGYQVMPVSLWDALKEEFDLETVR